MTPIPFTWDGEAMVPLKRFHNLCDQQYTVGEVYRLGVLEARSQTSHSHYFAALNEAWKNLPEDIAERYPTPEHLRKWALIKAGYADERSIVCANKAEAQRVASFVKPMDDFAIVVVSEATIKVYTAQSQSVKAMSKGIFQKSKQEVLDIVSGLIGVAPEALSAEAKRGAA